MPTAPRPPLGNLSRATLARNRAIHTRQLATGGDLAAHAQEQIDAIDAETARRARPRDGSSRYVLTATGHLEHRRSATREGYTACGAIVDPTRSRNDEDEWWHCLRCPPD